jgi:hypothetical protein
MPGKFIDSRINQNIEVATEYFRAFVSEKTSNKNGELKQSAGSIGFIPFNISFTMDGISGIKIYSELSVDTSFLPPGYTNTTNFIVTGVDHKIQNGDWETNITTTLIPRTSTLTNKITGSISIEGQRETPPTVSTTTPTTPGTPQPGNTEQERANNLYAIPYGLSPLQTPTDGNSSAFTALLRTFQPPYPLLYSGTQVNVNQSLVNVATGVKENVKMSDLTYDYSSKLWKSPSGASYKPNAITKPINFKVHKDAYASLYNAFTQIQSTYGMEQVWALGLNTCSGIHYPKWKTGSTVQKLSMHTWGVAIDLLAGLNPLKGPNSKSPKAQFSKPEYAKFISIMEQNGWLSLGKNSNYDWMHFQTVTY